MIDHQEYKIISGSAGLTVTGSIDKIFALGASSTTATLARVEFGRGVSKGHPNATSSGQFHLIEDIDIAGGSYLHGPIGRAKCGAAGGAFLFYLRK